MAYFHEYQLLPLKRTQEAFKDLYGQSIGEGTIVSACKELAQKVKPANEALKKHNLNPIITPHIHIEVFTEGTDITFVAETCEEPVIELGKYKEGGGCLYINKLSDIKTKELEKIIKLAVKRKK